MIAALALAVAAPALWISFPSAPAKTDPCRAEQFVSALTELRPSLEIRLGAAADPSDATAAIAIGADGWTLEVVREGKPPLHRALPSPQGDCVETASTAALMIDRALDDLHWSGGPVRIEPLAKPGALAHSEVLEEKTVEPEMVGTANIDTQTKLVDASTIEPAPTKGAATRPLATSHWLELGVGGASVFGSVEPLLSLEYSGRRGAWSLGLALDAALPFAGPVGGDPKIGTFAGFEGSLHAQLGRRFEVGPGSIRAEGGLGLELARASASGPLLEQENPSTALGMFALARLGYELPLPNRFALALRLQGQLFLRPIDFAVEGYPGGLSSSRGAATLLFLVSRNFF